MSSFTLSVVATKRNEEKRREEKRRKNNICRNFFLAKIRGEKSTKFNIEILSLYSRFILMMFCNTKPSAIGKYSRLKELFNSVKHLWSLVNGLKICQWAKMNVLPKNHFFQSNFNRIKHVFERGWKNKKTFTKYLSGKTLDISLDIFLLNF